MFKKYCFSARTKGLHILILGGVHGNEIAGSIAQKEIINMIENGDLQIKSGMITFVPTVNEEAQKKD